MNNFPRRGRHSATNQHRSRPMHRPPIPRRPLETSIPPPPVPSHFAPPPFIPPVPYQYSPHTFQGGFPHDFPSNVRNESVSIDLPQPNQPHLMIWNENYKSQDQDVVEMWLRKRRRNPSLMPNTALKTPVKVKMK